MAGTESKQSDAPSLPLYLAGLIVTCSSILAVNAALPLPDDGWMTDTLLLAGLGCLFSFGSRRLGIPASQIDMGLAALALLLLALFATGALAWEQFLPLNADKPDLRLLSSLAYLSTVWAWTLHTDNRVLGTTVPALATLGLAATMDPNNPVLACFGIFIVTEIFLLIHQNYLQNRARAAPESGQSGRQGEGRGERRLLLAEFAQTGLCSLGVLLAGLLVIVPAQAIFSRLSLAQTIRQLAAIGAHEPAAGSSALHFSDDDTLAIGTGDAWSASAEVVMRVTPSDGQAHYWRGRTYDRYTGDGWQSSLENQSRTLAPEAGPENDSAPAGFLLPPDLTPGDSPAPSALPAVTATFQVLGDTSQFYYAADPRRIMLDIRGTGSASLLNVCRDGRLALEGQGAVRFPYAVVSQPALDPMQPEAQARLRRTGTNYPSRVRALYLPIGVNGITQSEDVTFYRRAVTEATQDLPPARRDPLDEALALRDWVAARCVYSTAVPPIPAEADHVHAFLGDTRRGYCDMFASSLTILCRAAGIPARLATGFAPGDPNGDSFNLRGEDKHAWTEVYFPQAGWVAFDPTAGSRTDGTVPNAQSPRSGGWLSRLRRALGAGWEFVWPLLALIGLILAYVLKTEGYDRRRGHNRRALPDGRAESAPQAALGRQYARLTRTLARLGLPRRPAETPAEYAARVTPLLPALERELGIAGLSPTLVTGLTDAFTQTCYGPPAAEASLRADAPMEPWQSALARFAAATRTAQWRRFWARATLPAIRPRQTRAAK